MIMMPPRHGKSEIFSRALPAKAVGDLSDLAIMSFSSTQPLAVEFGSDVRNTVQSPEFAELYPYVSLTEDTNAKGRWNTNKGGSYFSAGVGRRILGRGFHLGIVDDAFGSMADAKSQPIRDSVWNWYLGTFYNRREPGASIVVINHRMHEDDLSGRLLEQQAAGGDTWNVIELPAIDDDGGALWPERYPIEALQKTKAAMAAGGKIAEWEALYQQNPTVPEGDYYRRDWFRYYDREPEGLAIYGSTDFALTKDDGDWTVHTVVGVDESYNIYLLEVWRARVTPDISVATLLDMAEDYRPLFWAVDKDIIVKSIGPFLNREMEDRNMYVHLQEYTLGRQDKRMRSQSFRSMAARGKVFLPRNFKEHDWVPGWLHEHLAFDAGRNDDQVDGSGLIGRLLEDIVSGGVLPEVEKPVVDAYQWGIDDEGVVA